MKATELTERIAELLECDQRYEHVAISGTTIIIGDLDIQIEVSERKDKVFVVEGMTRSEIAESLNEFLGSEEFKPNDERLSDALCKSYASHISGIEFGQGTAGFEDEVAELNDKFAAAAISGVPTILDLPII
jgi:hypothetical protein